MVKIYDEIYYDLSYEEEYQQLVDEIIKGKRIACTDANCTGVINDFLECSTCGKSIDYNTNNRDIDKIAYILSVAKKRGVSVKELVDSIDGIDYDNEYIVKIVENLENFDKIFDVINISKKYGRDATEALESLKIQKDSIDRIKIICQNYCISKYIECLSLNSNFSNIEFNPDVKIYSISGYKRLSLFLTFLSLVVSFLLLFYFNKRSHDVFEKSLLFSIIFSVFTYVLIRFFYWVVDGFLCKNKYIKIK